MRPDSLAPTSSGRSASNAASSHEHNQAGPAQTTAEAAAVQRLCVFTLIK
jgi:hypothetical protein